MSVTPEVSGKDLPRSCFLTEALKVHVGSSPRSLCVGRVPCSELLLHGRAGNGCEVGLTFMPHSFSFFCQPSPSPPLPSPRGKLIYALGTMKAVMDGVKRQAAFSWLLSRVKLANFSSPEQARNSRSCGLNLLFHFYSQGSLQELEEDGRRGGGGGASRPLEPVHKRSEEASWGGGDSSVSALYAC